MYSSGKAGKFTHLNILSINAKLLSSNTSIDLIDSPVEVDFELRNNIGYYGVFYISKKQLQPDFVAREGVVVSVEFELSNKKTLLKHRSTAEYL